MTSIITRNTAFGGITAMGGPNPSPLIAIAGPRHTILHAEKSGDQMVYLGESEDLGAEPLAVNNETTSIFHVLTAEGMVRVTDDDAPEIVSSTTFDPGGGKWLALYGGTFLATPLAKGGVQVIHAVTGAQISKLPGIVSDSRFAYGYASNNVLYVVDGKTASITVLKVNSSTGALSYVGKVRAPNCRDIVKVVLDENPIGTGNLFVVCRRRIVRFTVPLSAVTDNDTLLPTFAEDYGTSTADYTDLVVIGEDQYWIGQDYPTAATPLDAYYGPMLGVWDVSLNELFVAAPKSSIWTVNNVIPYYDATTIDETVDPPVPPVVVPPVVVPPVVTPSPPVITSSLTASVTEDTLFSYTITATGTGPITYGVTSPPSWLTSINPFTGVISGTPPDPGTVNITITATNAGGTTSATLVVTVMNAIAALSAVTVNGEVSAVVVSGTKVYIAGTFTSVSDASGALSRTNSACLDYATGLWTSWNPTLTTPVSGVTRLYADSSGRIYIAGVTTINGAASNNLRRVDGTTGATDSGWLPDINAVVYGLQFIGSDVYISGPFSSVNSTTRRVGAALSLANATLQSWTPLRQDGTIFANSNSGGGMLYDGSMLWIGTSTLQTGAQIPSRGFSNFSPGTGIPNQMNNGIAMLFSHRIMDFAINGSSVLGVGDFVTPSGDITNIPEDTSLGQNRYQGIQFSTSGTVGSSTAIDNRGDVYHCKAYGAGFFVCGSSVSVGGNASYNGLAKLTSAGALDTSFPASWGSPQIVYDMALVPNGLVIVGAFDSTLNGSTRQRFAIMHPVTGAVY